MSPHGVGSFRGGLSDDKDTHLSLVICGIDTLNIQIDIISVSRTERNALQYVTNSNDQILPLHD